MPTKSNQKGATQSSGRGFASMDKDKQRAAAKKGGEHSHSGGGRSSES